MRMNGFFYTGRMISASKTAPKGHICVFNANICTKTKGKIWFGDLDLTADVEKLKGLATKEGETIFILREKDARFQNETKPLFENAVAEFDPYGVVRHQ
jgi:hypothetical protein